MRPNDQSGAWQPSEPVGAAPAVLHGLAVAGARRRGGDAAADVLAEALERGGYVRLARARGAPAQVAEFRRRSAACRTSRSFFVRVIGRVARDSGALVAEVDRVLARVAEGALGEPALRRARLRIARAHRSAMPRPAGPRRSCWRERRPPASRSAATDRDEWTGSDAGGGRPLRPRGAAAGGRVTVLAEGER